MKFIDELALNKKRILMRADFNVPLDDSGKITDDTRIRSVLPTINYALDEGASVILASHLGRPKGKVKDELSLAPIAKRLARLLEKDVTLAPDCIGKETEKLVKAMKPGDVLLLENLRFHPEETKNDAGFGKALAKLADVYINDAFATAHRKHASNVSVAEHIKIHGAGLLMKKELSYFSKAMN
ncbi:MAG: phosphoglycerate kinase, partial [Proteobacteria bacterium]|nr:phosphoglycerate kinase [Pseudomonadota bacterium]